MPFPHRLGSKAFLLNSNRLNLAQTGKADVQRILEDFVARIDVPILDILYIAFFYQLIFDTPMLSQYISRTADPKAHETCVVFSDSGVCIVPARSFAEGSIWQSRASTDSQIGSFHPSRWQVCSSTFPQAFISSSENLYIREREYPRLLWQYDVENAQGLELFHLFTSVKNLYLSREFAPRIAPVLQELVGERAIDALYFPSHLHLMS